MILWLAFVPPLLIGWLIWRFGVDAPLVDEWSMVHDIKRYLEGSWNATDIFRPHNSHRIALSRLILVPLAVATDWDPRWAMRLGWAIMVGGAALVVHGARVPRVLHSPHALQAPRAHWLHALVVLTGSVAWFSASQYENWVWEFMISALLATVGVVATLCLLRVEGLSWLRLGAAAAVAVLASFSHGLGLAAWAGGGMVIVLSEDRRRLVKALAWAALAIVFCYLYSRGGGGSTSYVWQHPLRYGYFFLTFLGAAPASFTGSAWPPSDSGIGAVAGAIGLAAAALLAVVGWRQRERMEPADRFAWGLIAASIAAALLAGLGRAVAGGPAAYASRYITHATPLWIGLLVLLEGRHRRQWSELFDKPRSARRSGPPGFAIPAAVATLLVAFSWGSLVRVPEFQGRQRILTLPREALAHGGPEPFLAALHPEVIQVRTGLPVLERHHLSVFRSPVPPRIAGTEPLATFEQRVEVDSIPRFQDRLPTSVSVRVLNPSTATPWPYLGPDFNQAGAVRLSSRWWQGTTLIREGPRTNLPFDFAPGGQATLRLCLEPPPRAPTNSRSACCRREWRGFRIAARRAFDNRSRSLRCFCANPGASCNWPTAYSSETPVPELRELCHSRCKVPLVP